jgi:exonuclease VII large subunit
MVQRNEEFLRDRLNQKSLIIERATNAVSRILNQQNDRLKHSRQRFFDTTLAWLPLLYEKIEGREKILRQLDPKRVLARGYGIVTSNGKVLKDVSTLEIGAAVGVQLTKGSFESYVTKKENF